MRPKSLSPMHYAWIVAAVAFLAVMVPAALRGVLSIVAVPVEREMDWPRSVVGTAAALSMLLFGALAPFAAALVLRVGVRRVMMGGLALVAASMAAALVVRSPVAFVLVWGLCVGVGAGVLGMVMGNLVVQRWFLKGRGLAMGMMGAGIAGAQLLVMPPAAWVAREYGWRVAVAGAGLLALVALLAAARWMRERPRDVGALRYGEETPAREPEPAPGAAGGGMGALRVLRDASKAPAFWLLGVPFFICGLSTGGLIAIHLVPASIEHGVPDVRAATLLSVIGVFDFIGTLGAGWLSDRYDNARLLAGYYVLRGATLLLLPAALAAGAAQLTLFAVVYGLGWVATVPPTTRLAAAHFGEERSSVVFGWLFALHQAGAALAAWGAGLVRDHTGGYTAAFLAVALVTIGAGLLSLTLQGTERRLAAPKPAADA